MHELVPKREQAWKKYLAMIAIKRTNSKIAHSLGKSHNFIGLRSCKILKQIKTRVTSKIVFSLSSLATEAATSHLRLVLSCLLENLGHLFYSGVVVSPPPPPPPMTVDGGSL